LVKNKRIDGFKCIIIFIDKSIADAHISAIVLSSNLALCCGKDGYIRLFRNYHEVKIFYKKNFILFYFSYP